MELEVASWSKCFERFANDRWWVFETCCEGAAVDVVEWLREEPLFFCIVDLENAICGDAGGVRSKS